MPFPVGKPNGNLLYYFTVLVFRNFYHKFLIHIHIINEQVGARDTGELQNPDPFAMESNTH